MGLLLIGIVITAVVVFDLLAFSFGVDTRPGFGGVGRPSDGSSPD